MEPEDPAAEPCDFADEGCLLTVVGCCKETLPFYLWSEALLIDSFFLLYSCQAIQVEANPYDSIGCSVLKSEVLFVPFL